MRRPLSSDVRLSGSGCSRISIPRLTTSSESPHRAAIDPGVIVKYAFSITVREHEDEHRPRFRLLAERTVPQGAVNLRERAGAHTIVPDFGRAMSWGSTPTEGADRAEIARRRARDCTRSGTPFGTTPRDWFASRPPFVPRLIAHGIEEV